MESRKNRAAVWIAGLIAVFMIVPGTRSVLLFQAKLGTTPSSSFDTLMPKETRSSSARDVGGALVIARREAEKSKSVAPYAEAIAQYPNEPVLYANVLRYACLYGPMNRVGRPDLATPDERRGVREWKPITDSPELRLIETSIAKGKELDPDNAVFDFYEAQLRFEQKRDLEALTAIHRAAAKRDYDDYVGAESSVLLRNLEHSMGPLLYWMSPVQKVYTCAAVLFPQYSGFRNVARQASAYARQEAEAGNASKAMSITADTIKTAGVMEDSSDWAIGALVAISMQESSVQWAYRSLVEPIPGPTYRQGEDLPYPELMAALRAKVPDALSQAEWASLQKRVKQSGILSKKIRTFFAEGHAEPHILLLIANVGLLSLGGSAVLLALIFGGTWLIAHWWLSMKGRGDLQAGPSKLSIWLLALLPPMLVLSVVLALGQTPVHYLISMNSGDTPGPLDALAVGLKLATILLVIVIAGSGSLRTERGARFEGFLARVRTGSIYAIRGLLVVYLATMAVSIPLAAYVNQDVDRWINSEMQMVRDFHPPAK